ncbi:DNA-binding FadR family transcriptional regulator [Ochrobactrum daejeonense]|uniref:DNA-binding FadR family transcriptional regulator n=1 Tax=Brucella daejeonensis TaxID=659015 RepID=A0A7W9AXG1_9HYPH|nr:FadR/GntR family transcriptional regulator [Brucella daejeonensis]MBB5702202.1 DNA-binding FadR family transcriptional regulator [Brucella daejeonensis]
MTALPSSEPARKSSSVAARPRVKNGVISALALDICSDTFPPGSFLPRENDLCARYGVSRTVIREALKVLESKGLVRGRSRVGTIVCEHEEWNILDPQVIEWLGDRVIELNLLDCVLEARRCIEPAAVIMAARKATTQEIADLEHAWQMMRDAESDLNAFTEADVLFHSCLFKASHNRIFRQLSHTISAALKYSLQTSNEIADKRDEAVAAHGNLVEALRMKDETRAIEAIKLVLDMAERDLDQAKTGPARNAEGKV